MALLFVTAMYDLYPNTFAQNLSIGFRLEQLRKLLACNVEIVLFTDPALTCRLPPPSDKLQIIRLPIEEVAAFGKIMAAGNSVRIPNGEPTKDTLAYHALMNSKVEFLLRAAREQPGFSDYTWIDGNIFKIFDDDAAGCAAIESLVLYQYPDQITLPSGASPPLLTGDFPNGVYWRFLGGLFIVPSKILHGFASWYYEFMDELLQSGRITWEVNILAMLEARRPELFFAFKADHNLSMVRDVEEALGYSQQT